MANRPDSRLHAHEAAAAIEQERKKDLSQDVFWLYELTRGEGIFQAVRGPHAERIIKQVASEFPESGEPFWIGAGVSAAWLDQAMKLAENYARAWQHDVEGSFMVKKQADKAKAALLEHVAGVVAASATAHLSAYEDAVSTGNEGVKAAAPARPMSLDEFFAEAKRLNLTAADLVPALRARPEFADCLPDRVASLPASRVTRAADPSESDAKVAQREGYDEGWNDCLKAVAAADVALPAATEFSDAKRTIMEVLSEQDVRALAVAQFVQLKFHEKYGNAMQNACTALRAEQAHDLGVTEALRPCRSPYCECDQGKCTHPGFYDARSVAPSHGGKTE